MPPRRSFSVPHGDRDGSMLRCRTYGHAWDEFNAPPDTVAVMPSMWLLSLRCLRCDCERHDSIDVNNNLAGRRYIYPDGYRDVLGTEKMSRAEYRHALYERLRVKTTTGRGAA